MTTTVPESLVVDFDVYDPSLAEPVDVMQDEVAKLRALNPVVWSTAQGGHWIVTGYDEVHAILRDHETFSSWPNNLVLKDAGVPMIPIELDPPDHLAFRQALQPLFNPTRMRALEPEIRATVNELIDAFASTGEAEFVSAFAHELPARVFLTLMGWPHDDAPMFTHSTDAILLGKPGGTEEESAIARMTAVMELFGYFGNVVAQRRADPSADDITNQIIFTPVSLPDGERLLTDEELSNMFFLLLIAGLHTVQGSLAWSLLHLMARPEQRAQIIADPAKITDAVEEILRIEGAISMGRRATRDVEVAGVQIREGDQVLCIIAAANRDEREFADPDDLQIERTPNRHLAFGSGVHRCLGSHLARVELRISLEEVHRRLPDYELDTTRPLACHSSQVRGVISLPIRFTPEAS